jgi:transposase
MTLSTIGVDISKDWLDVHRLPDGESCRLTNDTIGHKALIRWLDKTPVERVVYEPTGPYHRAFERALSDAGFALCKVNPRQARRFAEVIGKLAKTDRADAVLLARFGQLLRPRPRPARDQISSELKELNVAREALVKDRSAAKNRAKTLTQPLLKRHNAQRLKQVSHQIEAVEKAITAHLENDPQLGQRFNILVTIPGISRLTAFALLIEMPELGTLDNKQAASLAGLAPVTRQSGRWKGHAFIRGGRAQLRRALYMPALVAARFNPDLKAKYDQLIAAGKPAKIAITAIMRKLIVLANTLIKANRMWTKKLA